MLRKLFIFLLFAISGSLFGLNLNYHNQVILVITDDWGCNEAQTWLCQRSNVNQDWKIDLTPIATTLSPKGLAWGKGLHPNEKLIGPRKKFSDSRSPAGIFKIGPILGWPLKEEMNAIKMPYIHISNSLKAISDIHSKSFNQIVDSRYVEKDWKSEIDLSKSTCLKLGAVVEYNVHPAIPTEGGCTFILEDTKDPSLYEFNYTAYKREDLNKVLLWLKQRDRPVLVQLTKKDYLKFKKKWALPNLTQIKK